jgi:hypothetical protein
VILARAGAKALSDAAAPRVVFSVSFSAHRFQRAAMAAAIRLIPSGILAGWIED